MCNSCINAIHLLEKCEGKIGVHTFAFSEVFLKTCGLLKHSILEDGELSCPLVFKVTPLIFGEESEASHNFLLAIKALDDDFEGTS